MDRQDAIKQRILSELEKEDILSDPRNNMMSFTSGIRLAKKIVSEIEVDQKPISLTDLLGWEEGVEYECYDDKFIIMDNQLYIWNYTKRDWIDAYSVSINRFEQLTEITDFKR